MSMWFSRLLSAETQFTFCMPKCTISSLQTYSTPARAGHHAGHLVDALPEVAEGEGVADDVLHGQLPSGDHRDGLEDRIDTRRIEASVGVILRMRMRKDPRLGPHLGS